MHRVAELCVEVVDEGINVFLEELTKGHLEFGGSGSVTEDMGEDLGGDECLNPLDNGEIFLYPLRIGGVTDEVGGGMTLKVATSEFNIEEVAPMVIVVGRCVEVNWDKGANIGYSICKRERSSHDGRGKGWSG
jgi:hypothetical protein